MRRLSLAVFLLCGGCRFGVDALSVGADPPDLSAPVGGGKDPDAPDLGGPELGTPDLDAPDVGEDPCGRASALDNGNIAARCVADQPPGIDGKLDEWPSGGFVPMTHASAAQVHEYGGGTSTDADISARFSVAWDPQFFYVAAIITDDIRGKSHPDSLVDDDSLEVFFDGNHGRTVAYGGEDWQLIFSAGNRTVASHGGTNLVTFPAGVEHKIGGASPDWILEARIPWSILGGQAAAGRVIGFDLKLDDEDGDGEVARDLVMYYTAPPGGLCVAPECRTDAFGAVQLQGR